MFRDLCLLRCRQAFFDSLEEGLDNRPPFEDAPNSGTLKHISTAISVKFFDNITSSAALPTHSALISTI